jgi:hypothetical protein
MKCKWIRRSSKFEANQILCIFNYFGSFPKWQDKAVERQSGLAVSKLSTWGENHLSVYLLVNLNSGSPHPNVSSNFLSIPNIPTQSFSSAFSLNFNYSAFNSQYNSSFTSTSPFNCSRSSYSNLQEFYFSRIFSCKTFSLPRFQCRNQTRLKLNKWWKKQSLSELVSRRRKTWKICCWWKCRFGGDENKRPTCWGSFFQIRWNFSPCFAGILKIRQ